MNINTCTHMDAYTQTHILHTDIHAHMHTRTHAHTETDTQTDTDTHIHTDILPSFDHKFSELAPVAVQPLPGYYQLQTVGQYYYHTGRY